MVAIPLGQDAYKRTFAGEPEIRLENRYVEVNPGNLREHSGLLARPGSLSLRQFASNGFIRGTYWKPGMFNNDLFVVSGPNFYRYATDGTLQTIPGTISGLKNPYVTWQKGIGYERLFIADGSNLQYYNTHAMGTLTLSGGPITNQVITIAGVYYSWSATVNAGTPAGTIGAPYLALLGSGGVSQAANDQASLLSMERLLNFNGISGYDYSSTVPRNTLVTATATATTLVLTAIQDLAGGNTITTTVSSGSFLAWGAATLTGGGNQALQLVPTPSPSEVIKSLASSHSYVLASVGFTQKIYFINPGEVTIQALDFMSKESNPDNVVDMHAVGDNIYVSGEGSTENWYATGDFNLPFAPQEGRVYRRGTIEGTTVVVDDSLILVGDDGIVYEIGYQYGGSAAWGVHRISTNGIEERIRTQMRRLQGLS